MVTVVRMNSEIKRAKSSIDIVSMLFTHSLAYAIDSMAKCHDETTRVFASETIAKVLRCGRFVMVGFDLPMSLSVSEGWLMQADQLYSLWIDVMDGKVAKSGTPFSATSQMVRSGFGAVLLRAFVDEREPNGVMSAEDAYEIYARVAKESQSDARVKPFSSLGASARRAWFAVATAIARLNRQPDPDPTGISVPDVLAALGLVSERFGPPLLAAA
jgi:hypothetical protein